MIINLSTTEQPFLRFLRFCGPRHLLFKREYGKINESFDLMVIS